MKRLLFTLLVILTVPVLLAACGGGETPTPTPATEMPPAEDDSPAVEDDSRTVAQDDMQAVPVTDIQNITWQWVELLEHEPAAQSVVPNPENYTLTFFDDGTMYTQVDCNQGSGSYTVAGSQIMFGPMALTRAMCPPDSLHDQFIQLLNQVDAFGMSVGKLVLTLKDGAGEMRFQNSGPALKPTPPPEEITLYVGPERVPCEGAGPQECYKVKETLDGEWQLFYGRIEGFQYEPGYIYELRVNVYEAADPPADASSLRYELVEVVSKTQVNVENVTGIDPASVTIDTFNLPYSYQPNLVQAVPYDNSQPPGPTGLPQHIQINFGVPDPADVQPGDPLFYIIPTAAYLEMWETAGDPGVKNTMSLLRITLNETPEPLPIEGMPVLPNERVTGYNDLAVQGSYLTFELGYGVRFVGRFTQDPSPVSNEGLFYIFQGFSHDGQYFYAFFYPVATNVLPDSAVDVPEDELGQFNDDQAAYMLERAQVLNGLAPADWDTSLETLDSLVASLSYEFVVEKPEPTPEPTPEPSLTGVMWEWSRFTDPLGEFIVPDPTLYWIVFGEEDDFYFQADCNTGNGSYTTSGGSIALSVSTITQALCDDGSLSDRFVTNLGYLGAYFFHEGQLVLELMADGGQMFFRNAGNAVLPPQPDEDTPVVVTIEPVNVRSGPGTQYPTYGAAPVGTAFEVVGISEDGAWWVVILSEDISSTGDGWLTVRNTEAADEIVVPVVPAPPLQEVVPPAPEPGTPTATALEPLNVRSGPGKEYESYGVVPAGATAEIIGRSADGIYWVVLIPVEIVPDGQGWVVAAYVTAENAEDVPVIEAP